MNFLNNQLKMILFAHPLCKLTDIVSTCIVARQHAMFVKNRFKLCDISFSQLSVVSTLDWVTILNYFFLKTQSIADSQVSKNFETGKKYLM